MNTLINCVLNIFNSKFEIEKVNICKNCVQTNMRLILLHSIKIRHKYKKFIQIIYQ